MSLCRIDLEWADGTYPFCLPLAQLEELQTLCDAGPMVILERLRHGAWTSKEVYHPIRLGLIGGGMPPDAALRKTRLYVLERPWAENVQTAMAVVAAVLFGKPEETVGKSRAAGRKRARRAARTESSTSASSTDSGA
ncbi:MAG: gene transfer agent family protein [Chelatococcus sp.]|nr:MAG: gene transfer agent family protein [Chelatococcus sp.]